MRITPLLMTIVFFASCLACSLQDAKDYYNLSFSEQRIWDGGFRWYEQQVSDTTTSLFFWGKDSVLPGKKLFRLTEARLPNKQRIPLRSIFSQKIALYSGNYGTANIAIRNKGFNLKSAWLKIYSLGKQEQYLRTDSIDIRGGNWHIYSLQVLLPNVHYLRLSIVVAGEDSDSQSGAHMWIDKLAITIDGKNLEDINYSQRTGLLILDEAKIKRLSFSEDNSLLTIPQLQSNIRILGIGETMHGCLTFGKIKNQIIKTLVKHKNCKLVMLELPSIIVLKWDLYIQNYPIDFSDIEEDLVGVLTPIEEIKELLNNLREYNRTVEKKVRIVGIDRSPKIYTSLIYDYFYEMYRQKPNKLIRKFMLNYESIHEVEKLLYTPEAASVLGNFEHKWFGEQYGVNFLENKIPHVRQYGVLNSRDYIMSLHVQNAIRVAELKENETAVILAHWVHVNKWDIENQPNRSLGYYLSKAYGTGYYAIGLLGGKGTFNTSRRGRLKSNYPLPNAEPGSIEAGALKTGEPYFYCPGESLPETPVRLRLQPYCYESGQFQDFAIQSRMDGFIFVRNCKGAPFPKWWTGKPVDRMKIYTERIKRKNVRENELKAKGL